MFSYHAVWWNEIPAESTKRHLGCSLGHKCHITLDSQLSIGLLYLCLSLPICTWLVGSMQMLNVNTIDEHVRLNRSKTQMKRLGL